MRLTSEEVEKIYKRAGVEDAFCSGEWNGVHLLDERFHTISGSQVRAAWEQMVKALPKIIKIRRGSTWYPFWEEESGDCENISFWLMSDIQKMNAATALTRGVKREGIAAIPIAYMARSREESGKPGGHCILSYINHRKTLKFFEPQIGKDIELTKQEIESIWFILGA